MGYYTTFNLKVHTDNEYEKIDIIKKFRETYREANYAIDEDGNSYEFSKWYNSEEDLKEFSLKYPKILFELEGYGEEQNDMWKLYVKNGKSVLYNAKIVFPKLNKKDLK